MFHKPFRVKSNVPAKPVERKKLKQKIRTIFPDLAPEQLEDLLPSKIPLFVIRLVTFGGVVVTTYHTEGDPIFFDHASGVCPSIYALWRYPQMLRSVMVENQTFSKLQYGSDLILPSVVPVEEGGYSLRRFKKGDYCSVRVQGQDMLSCVGMCLTSYEDMVKSSMKGVGFRMLHLQGDLLWEMGSMSIPIDSHLRTCITAAASQSSSGEVIPIPPDLPFLDDDMLAELAMAKDLGDEQIAKMPSFEDFKEAAIAAFNPSETLGTDSQRAIITHALEERTRYMKTLPQPKIRNIDKKYMRHGDSVFQGLSENPEVSLYQETQRILDNADDEIDEVGVTLPEKYQSDVPDTINKASQYYNRLGLHLSRDEKSHDEEGGSELEGEEEEADFREWLKNTSSSEEEEDEIGISVPKKYTPKKGTASKKKSKASKPKSTFSRPLPRPLTPPMSFLDLPVEGPGGMRELHQQLKSLQLKYEMMKANGKTGFDIEAELAALNIPLPAMEEEFDDDIRASRHERNLLLCDSEDGEEGPGEEGPVKSDACEGGEGAVATKTWYSMPTQRGKSPIPSTSLEDSEAMDSLIKECFFAALLALSKNKPADLLPLLTSTFYRSHMLETCLPGMKLDVKKTTYRKLSKFLLTMQQQGVIKLGENDKGSEVITNIEFKHPLVKAYTPCLLAGGASIGAEPVVTPAKPSLKINTLYMPSHRLISFFRQLGFTKASILDYQQVRESVLKYIKENELVDTKNPRQILPDYTLGDALQHRGAEANKGILRQELINMIIEEMKPAYSITRGDAAPTIKRGKLEPVKLSLVQKTGNKKVTLVDNLEYYGIPAAEVAQNLQKMAAASTTVNDVPGKPTARQVQIQGNAVKVIAKLLQESYGLPVKHIEAIDKIKPPKTSQKKRKKR